MVACVRTVRTLSGLRYPWKSGRHVCAKPAQPIQIRSPVPPELHLLYHGDAPHGAFFLYACRISAAFVRLCLAASGARLVQGASSPLVNTLHKQCKKPLSRTLFLFFFCFLVKTSTSANQYRLSQRFTKCADPLPPPAHIPLHSPCLRICPPAQFCPTRFARAAFSRCLLLTYSSFFVVVFVCRPTQLLLWVAALQVSVPRT